MKRPDRQQKTRELETLMRKLFKFTMAMALAGLLANTATAITIDDLDNGGEISIGDKIFGDFSWTPSGAAGGAQASDVVVTLGQNGGDYFIQFQGPLNSGLGTARDFALLYTVRTASGAARIDAIDQAFTFSSGGGGGLVMIGETARIGGFGGQAVGQSSIGFALVGDFNDPPGEPTTQGDQLTLTSNGTPLGNPITVSKLWITKDILLDGNGSNDPNGAGSVGATIIRQSFHQVPDGGSTLLLLGSALSALSLLGLRRKA